MSAISCTGISKSFGSSRVLVDLDLDVPDGAIVTVLGESGSGKTTLLRLIAGFERPDWGTIAVGSEVVDSSTSFVPSDKRRIGFVAQEGNLFPHLTARRNVAFGLSRSDRGSGRVEEMLRLVGLEGFGGRYPHQLSGGEQQRVALARALAPRPRLLLLDEPFSSLDASLRSSLRRDVMAILRDQHATTIFVTHDQSEALATADLVGIMDGGRIRQFARPEVLYDQPADASIAEFLGEANFLPGTASFGRAETVLGPLPLTVAARTLTGPVVVLVRPEQLTLRRLPGEPSDSAQPTGRVVHREYYGHDCVVLVALTGHEGVIRVRCPGRVVVELGDDVGITASGEVMAWSPDHARPT